MYGNNVLQDYTFTGNQTIDGATPTLANATSVTDFGELINDPDFGEYFVFDFNEQDGSYYFYDLLQSATPYRILTSTSTLGLSRFVDTKSAINILRI